MIEITEYVNGEYVKSFIDESSIETAPPIDEPVTIEEVLSLLEAILNE